MVSERIPHRGLMMKIPATPLPKYTVVRNLKFSISMPALVTNKHETKRVGARDLPVDRIDKAP